MMSRKRREKYGPVSEEEDNETKTESKDLKRIECSNKRCDEEITCVGNIDYFCSRECYQITQDLNNMQVREEDRCMIFKHVTIKGRGGTGLLVDKELLDFLVIQVSEKFGRTVTVVNSGTNAKKWKSSGKDKAVPEAITEEERAQKDEENQRLKALLNFDSEDSSDDNEKENEEAELIEAQEEIQALLSSGVNSSICRLHPPLASVLDRGKCLNLYVINVISPWEIHLQTIDMIRRTQEIDSILNRPEGIDSRLILPNWSPLVGGYCTAKYEDKYYRARILKKIDNNFEVKFVDYGNVDLVKSSELLQLNPEVTLIPRQCIYFKISNAKPKNGRKKWDEDACKFAIEHLDGAAVQIEFDAVEQKIIHVGKMNVLRSISGQILGDFGKALVERNLADLDSYFLL